MTWGVGRWSVCWWCVLWRIVDDLAKLMKQVRFSVRERGKVSLFLPQLDHRLMRVRAPYDIQHGRGRHRCATSLSLDTCDVAPPTLVARMLR